MIVEERRWLRMLVLSIGFLFCASLLLWWFYFMANWPVLISLTDNPYDSRIPAYLIWAGFGLYPAVVAFAFAFSWNLRKRPSATTALLVAFLPLLNILLFFAGAMWIAKSEANSFEKFAQEVARTPNDFVCSDGRYIQIEDNGVVGLVKIEEEGAIRDSWIGNIDSDDMSFTRSTSSDWPTAEELSTCRNAEGQVFLEVYRDLRS